MSQNSDDNRNNPRPAPPPRREYSNSPDVSPDYAVPSLIFDEYGEVKAVPPSQAPAPRSTPPPPPANGDRNRDETPSVPSLIFDEYGELKPGNLRPPGPAAPPPPALTRPPVSQYEPPSVPSLIFDEYGELKSAALNNFKPAPAPVQPANRVQAPVQPQVRPNPPAPVQPPPERQPLGRPAGVVQGPPPFAAPVQPVVAAAPPVSPVAPGPGWVVKNKEGRAGLGLWIGLGAAIVILLIGLGTVVTVLLNKPAPPANTTPVALGSLFPFKALTPGATTTANTATPGPSVSNTTGDLDALYNQATVQLKNGQFKEAAATLEQLRDKQNQSGKVKHPDAPALLFRAYVDLGDQLNKSSQFADFQQAMLNYQKAIDATRTLDAKDRNQQEETALQGRLDTGNLYIRAVTAYRQKDLDAAVPLFSQLYNKDQNFRDASNLFYDSLIRIGDGQFAENLLPQAYQSYSRATQLKNVTDTRYAQARATSIENQLRQVGKTVPTVPAP